ncbi:hypothetical protein IMSAG249_01989 [Lachnospiraceae bacterium]|nr:hypothetical protein IMSAGC009_03335 [Lachnospiraceae bacterium]GFI70162.1 hypothetical protein IMSAG249_01989 [Lachnospiraceae bacterium]
MEKVREDNAGYHFKKSFKEYFSDNKLMCFSALLCMILMYGKHAFTTNYLFDTDDLLYHTKDSTLNWLQIGRQGNVLTQKIFGLLWYNPYFVGALCLVLFPIVIFFMAYLFYQGGLKKSKVSLYSFVFLTMTSPIWVYQFYFSLQWFEMVWALFLITFAQFLIWKMFADEKWRKQKIYKTALLLLAEILLLNWAFSTYQTYVILFIFLSAGIYLISLVNEKDNFNEKEFGYRLGYLVVLFLAAYITNMLISNKFFTTSDYVTGMTVWGKVSREEILSQLKMYLFRCHTGKDMQYSALMGVGTVFMLMEIVFVWIQKKNKIWYKILFLLASLAVWMSAHAMNIYTGRVLMIRAQIVYPFVLGYQIMFLLWCIRENGISDLIGKVKYVGILLLTVIGIWIQMGNVFRLWYTEDMKCKADTFILQKVNMAIDSLNLYGEERNLPMAFVGNYSPTLNSGCINTKENMYWMNDASIGMSCWERVNEQPNRLIRIMSSQFGVDYVRLSSDEQVNRARENARDMPVYPYNGFAQVRDGMIIVKMSNDY